MQIVTKVLSPELWPDLEALFGKNGAVGGCWCMSWRIEKGESWADVKGGPAKKRFKSLVTGGEAHGILAYADGVPVGWCAFGPRRDFSRLDRAPSLKVDDADAVWSIPCFYVKAGFRSQGVSTAMLTAALKELKRRKVKIAEGYPAKALQSGEPIPAAFAWTGTVPLFTGVGFALASAKTTGKQRMRKSL
jgi:GNAT superfamily N-acetyltransferase